MSRSLSSGMRDAVQQAELQAHLLGEFDFDSGTIRMWTGIGTLSWNGNNYLGVGNLAGISPVTETQNLQAEGLTFNLSGIPSDIVALALTEQYQGRPCRLYLAIVNFMGALALEDGSVLETEDGGGLMLESSIIDTPYRIFSGMMDAIEMSDDGQTATIALTAENVLMLLKRKKERRYTPEDQKSIYPDDEGLDFINQLQDKKVIWGK